MATLTCQHAYSRKLKPKKTITAMVPDLVLNPKMACMQQRGCAPSYKAAKKKKKAEEKLVPDQRSLPPFAAAV
uniref:Uncharacterized protein n=1 Tax=Arundo donax TaxID=35708 RepID=A0A0A9E875_ARUDO